MLKLPNRNFKAAMIQQATTSSIETTNLSKKKEKKGEETKEEKKEGREGRGDKSKGKEIIGYLEP